MNDTELDEILDRWTAPAPPPSLRRGLVAALPEQRRKVLGMPLPWVVAGAAAALCAGLGAAAFDNPVLGRFYGVWQDEGGGLYMQTTRMIDPPTAQIKWWFTGSGYSIGGAAGALRGSADLHIRSTRTFYGYEYTLERIADGTYQAAFSPLQLATLKGRMGPYKFNGQVVDPPDLPAPRTVHVGEPFEVTLYRNGNERIYDRVLLSWSAPPDWPNRHSRPLPAGTMSVTAARLYIDGALVADAQNAGSGPVIWVHVPGQGRFLATTDPQGNARFQQAGSVNGNVIEFQSGGTQFRIVCSEPIVGGGARPVFVYHQQSFEDLLDPAHPLAQRPFVGNAGPASLHVE